MLTAECLYFSVLGSSTPITLTLIELPPNSYSKIICTLYTGTYGYRMTTLDSRTPYCINSHKNNHMSTCVHEAKKKKGDHR